MMTRDPTDSKMVDGWNHEYETDDTVYYSDDNGHLVGITTAHDEPYQIVLQLSGDHPKVDVGFVTVVDERSENDTSAYATAVGMMTVCNQLAYSFLGDE